MSLCYLFTPPEPTRSEVAEEHHTRPESNGRWAGLGTFPSAPAIPLGATTIGGTPDVAASSVPTVGKRHLSVWQQSMTSGHRRGNNPTGIGNLVENQHYREENMNLRSWQARSPSNARGRQLLWTNCRPGCGRRVNAIERGSPSAKQILSIHEPKILGGAVMSRVDVSKELG